jgi:hypothetical protein
MLNTNHFITGCGWDRNTLIVPFGRQWQSECYESQKEIEEGPTSFTHTYTWHTLYRPAKNDTSYDIWITMIFPLSSPCLSLRGSVTFCISALLSWNHERERDLSRWNIESLFKNILGSVGDVINLQTRGLIPIIRRKYTDRKQHVRMHGQYTPPLKSASQQI